MYEYVNDVLRAKKIDPKDVMLIRHTDSPKDKEHRFRKAQEAGFVKEYTAMQETGFAKDRDYLLVFIGERPTFARFFALYQIVNRFPVRKEHIPASYPNKREVEEDGEYLELREEQLPEGLAGFVIEWGRGTVRWCQKAEREKRIIEIQTTTNTNKGGAQE